MYRGSFDNYDPHEQCLQEVNYFNAFFEKSKIVFINISFCTFLLFLYFSEQT